MDQNPNQTARKMAEVALRRLAAELEANHGEALTNYLSAMSRFRGQSWSNVLLIAAQRPDATRVAGHHGWRDLGRAVKKGEKGIVIFSGLGGKSDYPFRPATSRAAFVFDASQTEGKPLTKITQTDTSVWTYGERLKSWAVQRGLHPQLKLDGLSSVQSLSTLAHELAHDLLQHRQEANALPCDAIKAQAAGVAYVVARGLGIQTHAERSDFPAHYGGDKRLLAQTLAAIQETSTQILGGLHPEERSPALPVPLDAKTFGDVYRRYGDRLIQSIAGFVKDQDSAEEIVARAFQRAWEKRDAFRGESLPSTWIEAIARNEARQFLTRERNGRFDTIDRPEARELAAPEVVSDVVEKRYDQLQLRNALARLPMKQRRALTAHFIDGVAIREIASREQVPLGTVLSRIASGKQLLRQAWARPVLPNVEATIHGTAAPKLEAHGPKASERSGYQRPESPDLTWGR
jgi:RNA polymerase sigma factor (sigma-70 family)